MASESSMPQTKYGSRAEVWNGLALMTRGGLMKDMLVISRTGRIVSKKKSEQARRNYEQNNPFKKKTKVESEPEAEKKPADKPADKPVEEPAPKRRRRRRRTIN